MKLFKSFTLFEAALWLFSVLVIVGSAYFFGSDDIMTLGASLVGVTSLIFIAKGHYIDSSDLLRRGIHLPRNDGTVCTFYHDCMDTSPVQRLRSG